MPEGLCEHFYHFFTGNNCGSVFIFLVFPAAAFLKKKQVYTWAEYLVPKVVNLPTMKSSPN
jgi:hypothetical protein